MVNCYAIGFRPRNVFLRPQLSAPNGGKIMPIILWLLGVPIVVIVLLYVLHVV